MFDSLKEEASNERLNDLLRGIRSDYGQQDWFRGADAGFRWHAGQAKADVCIRVHVDQKKSPDLVLAPHMLPQELDGIRIDVIGGAPSPVSLDTAESGANQHQSYAMGDIQCQRVDRWSGKGQITLIARCNQTGAPGILSTWQALAGAGAELNDPIARPSSNSDCFDPRNSFAILKRWHLGAAGDAAFAELLPEQPWLPIQHGNCQPVAGIRAPKLGEVLQISSPCGRGVIQARVDGIGQYKLPYETKPGQTSYQEIEGFRLTPLPPREGSQPLLKDVATSGSAWISAETKEAVGLNFGVSHAPSTLDTQEHTSFFACSLPQVFDALDLRLATFADLVALGTPENSKTSSQNAHAQFAYGESSSPMLELAEEDNSQSFPRRETTLSTVSTRQEGVEVIDLPNVLALKNQALS